MYQRPCKDNNGVDLHVLDNAMYTDHISANIFDDIYHGSTDGYNVSSGIEISIHVRSVA